MIPLCSPLSLTPLFSFNARRSSHDVLPTKGTPLTGVKMQFNTSESSAESGPTKMMPLRANGLCLCGRRHFFAAATALLPICPPHSKASPDSVSDYTTILNRFHPPRPDWYEEFYASVLNSSTKSYEAEIGGYKSQLFANLRGKAQKVLEIGVGTGSNIQYYTNGADVQVLGTDPNRKMEKYAKAAALSAGVSPMNFKFIQAVGEAIPLTDSSVDAVVGTLVLCSVTDVDQTLQEVKRVLKPGGVYVFVEHVAAKEGTILRFIQGVLDPLQQAVADGCHLTRETGKDIYKAGFSNVDLNTAFLSSASIVNPQVYGIARK
ncbi:hypothetical protein K2173_021971 [Erythroxylum novogranatense]|uniref:Methyltransferase type 11 domain-containing protein n=1 Tax=Erythroxylum novogranatense TaxID=1862640 RepID=A0AAV8T305_9ROSI|nr:hypothetical protein K2173_021971 [Erythroxylum novogranatense]